jgi:hypothetical protein
MKRILAVMVVTVDRAIVRLLGWLNEVCLLVIVDDFPHPVKGHSDFLALLEHPVYFL